MTKEEYQKLKTELLKAQNLTPEEIDKIKKTLLFYSYLDKD